MRKPAHVRNFKHSDSWHRHIRSNRSGINGLIRQVQKREFIRDLLNDDFPEDHWYWIPEADPDYRPIWDASDDGTWWDW